MLFALSVVEFHLLAELYLLLALVLVLSPILLWFTFTNRQRARVWLFKIGVYIVTLIAMFAQDGLQSSMAQRHAIRIGDACLAYSSKYHHYPQTLDELVPEFLPSVPRAKFGAFGQFFYAPPLTEHGEPMLMDVEIPPFGRTFYHMESRRWGYLD